MKAKIYCKTTDKGTDNFYLLQDGITYFLFQQSYRKSVHAYFRQGVFLDDIFDYAKAKGNRAIEKTLSKLPGYIKYIESEYEIVVLLQTQKQNRPFRTERLYA